MARTVLALQTTVRTGLNPTYSAATVDGHAFDNSSGRVYLHVKNASASPVNVTIDVTKTTDGLVIPDLVVSVPASGERIIGPFPPLYEQVNAVLTLDKAIHVNTSAQASVTYAAIKLGSL